MWGWVLVSVCGGVSVGGGAGCVRACVRACVCVCLCVRARACVRVCSSCISSSESTYVGLCRFIDVVIVDWLDLNVSMKSAKRSRGTGRCIMIHVRLYDDPLLLWHGKSTNERDSTKKE